MIGLLDLDLQLSTSIKLHPPNLEIMKLATYYKIEEQKFCRLINLNETDLTSYDKIYIFSEKYNITQVPKHFLTASNIILGGTGLTNQKYIPFENEIIDFTLPRPAIYKEFLKEKYQDGIKANVISHVLDDTYYRQYAGENKLPVPAILPKKRLWVYDRNFFQDGWEDLARLAAERKSSGIFTIHPIKCEHFSDYLLLRKTTKVARDNTVLLDIPIPTNEIKYLFKDYTNFFLEDITESSKVFIPIGGTQVTSFAYFNDLIYKLNLLYSFWAHSVPMKVKYIEPQFGTTCSIANLLKLVEIWSGGRNKSLSIDDKIKSFKTKYKNAEEEKKRLLKFHKDAADLFKQSYNDLSTRRLWRI